MNLFDPNMWSRLWARRQCPDFADLLIIVGLSSLGTGLWWFRPWVSLAAVGAILLVLGIVGSFKGS